MPKMRAVQVPRAGGPLEIVEREIPEPGPGFVRIKVQACGVCHSDTVTKDGLFPGHPISARSRTRSHRRNRRGWAQRSALEARTTSRSRLERRILRLLR